MKRKERLRPDWKGLSVTQRRSNCDTLGLLWQHCNTCANATHEEILPTVTTVTTVTRWHGDCYSVTVAELGLFKELKTSPLSWPLYYIKSPFYIFLQWHTEAMPKRECNPRQCDSVTLRLSQLSQLSQPEFFPRELHLRCCHSCVTVPQVCHSSCPTCPTPPPLVRAPVFLPLLPHFFAPIAPVFAPPTSKIKLTESLFFYRGGLLTALFIKRNAQNDSDFLLV